VAGPRRTLTGFLDPSALSNCRAAYRQSLAPSTLWEDQRPAPIRGFLEHRLTAVLFYSYGHSLPIVLACVAW